MPPRTPQILLATLLATMLIGARFDASWAGGPGYRAPLTASMSTTEGEVTIDHHGTLRPGQTGESLTRGEIVRVNEGYGELNLGGSTLSLDARTDVEIISLLPERIELRVQRGRIALEHAVETKLISIYAGPADFTLSRTGWLSLTHYDFKGAVAVAPIGTAVAAVLEGTDSFVATTPFTYTYWNTPTTSEAQFDPTHPSVSAFYTRFLAASHLD